MLDRTKAGVSSEGLSGTPAYMFSVDVEDWFHILDLESAPSLNDWSSLPSRVEYNFHRILDLLSDHQTTATMFFLGWIAERYPHLVAAARARGHEIASHGYSHRLVYTMTPKEFVEDTRRARANSPGHQWRSGVGLPGPRFLGDRRDALVLPVSRRGWTHLRLFSFPGTSGPWRPGHCRARSAHSFQPR